MPLACARADRPVAGARRRPAARRRRPGGARSATSRTRSCSGGARAVAAGLVAARRRAGGDRVAIALPPGLEFAVALHGCLLLGAAAIPIDDRLAEPERERLRAGAATTIDGPLEPAPPVATGAPAEDAIALVVHTSGTTAAPRPVELSFGNVQANALGSAVALGLDRDERWLCPLPLSHVGGLMVLLRSAVYGTTALLAPASAHASATLASLVPTQLARLLDAGETARPAPARGPARRRAARPRAARAGARRRLAGRTDLRPDAGVLAGHGRRAGGHRDLRPPAARPARRDRAATARSSSTGPTVAGGGTLRTGDLGRLDDRGRLIVTGRKADTIVSGGENVAPAEVEEVLKAHPAVADAAVFGRPHPRVGRGGHRPRRPARARHAGRAQAVDRRAPRALQGPEGRRAGRRAAAHGVWQAAAPGADVTSREYREESRRRWAASAAGWEQRADWLRKVDDAGLRVDDRRDRPAAGPRSARARRRPRRHRLPRRRS